MSSIEELSMAMKGLMDNFMSRIDVILQVYGDYNKHTLGLWSKADFKQRFRFIQIIARVYTKRTLELDKVGRLIDRNDARVAKLEKQIETFFKTEIKKKGKKKIETKICLDNLAVERLRTRAENWRNENIPNQEWYDMQVDIVLQVEARFAGYREIALVEAFQQFKKDASHLLGVPRADWDEVKKKVAEHKKKGGLRDRFKHATKRTMEPSRGDVSPEHKKKLEELGADVDKLFKEKEK